MTVSLYTPQGTRMVQRDVIELPWGVMQKFIEFADLANRQALGIHCSRCSQDIVGANGDHDPVLKVACGCREFWSTNPRMGRA